MTELSPLPADYTALLGEIQQRVRQAQTRAVLAFDRLPPHGRRATACGTTQALAAEQGCHATPQPPDQPATASEIDALCFRIRRW